ncbi:DUF2637 domain-containing protein [Streptomyces sp. CA-288835]|uniref:DUF2637 domain-containing protein n=1 Tax=Streptomyces sp. CA-288835 TaxID=3240069 RepID=UPI003D8FBBAF
MSAQSRGAGTGSPDALSEAVGSGVGFELWVRPGRALVVASVAGYASYVHQREFALQGADAVSATLWPLSVDGLSLLATVGLLSPARGVGRRARAPLCGWRFFSVSRYRGVAVSLAANIAAAPAPAWKPMPVAAGRRSPCCSRWNCSYSVPEAERVPRAPVVRRRLTPRLRTMAAGCPTETRRREVAARRK